MRNQVCLLMLPAVAFFVLMAESCDSCNKKNPVAEAVVADTSATAKPLPQINYQHGDSSLQPVVQQAMDEVMDACLKKDGARLAAITMYRGLDENRYGHDVFNYKKPDERKVVDITAQVIRQWAAESDTFYTTRFLELPQPMGRKLQVIEVLFLSERNTNRKFFGFIEINGSYKLADITSYL